jgi:hypothetical protein
MQYFQAFLTGHGTEAGSIGFIANRYQTLPRQGESGLRRVRACSGAPGLALRNATNRLSKRHSATGSTLRRT